MSRLLLVLYPSFLSFSLIVGRPAYFGRPARLADNAKAASREMSPRCHVARHLLNLTSAGDGGLDRSALDLATPARKAVGGQVLPCREGYFDRLKRLIESHCGVTQDLSGGPNVCQLEPRSRLVAAAGGHPSGSLMLGDGSADSRKLEAEGCRPWQRSIGPNARRLRAFLGKVGGA